MRDKKSVSDPCLGYGKNMERWTLCADLLAGSQAMRDGSDPANGNPWLPRYSAEEPIDWQARLDQAELHALFGSAIDRVASQPFSRPVIVVDEERMDPRFLRSADGSAGYLDDLDGDGTSLTEFARAAYYDAAAYGITHALTRHTARSDTDRRGRAIAEHVPALSLIGWIHDDSGRLIDCRIRGSIVRRAEDNPWAEVEYQTVRRYFLGEDETVYSELYVVDEENKKRKDRGEAQLPDGDPMQLVDEAGRPLAEIPLLTLYFRRSGRMEALPPFYALAACNLEHWRAKSDYDSAVHGAAVPMLSMVGIVEESDDPNEASMQSREKVSVSRVLKSRNPDAKFEWIEISGSACEAALKRVEGIEKRAVTLGAQPESRAGVQTATAVWVDERSAQGHMASWNRATEAWITLVLWSMSEWMGATLPASVVANIPEDRPLTQARVAEVQALLQVYQSGDLLTRKTTLEALASLMPALEKVDPRVELELAMSELRSAGRGNSLDDMDTGDEMEPEDDPEDDDPDPEN